MICNSKCFCFKRYIWYRIITDPFPIFSNTMFAGYCNFNKFDLNDKVTEDITKNMLWYDHLSRVCLGWKNVSLTSWLKRQKYKSNTPDELCLYALSVIFCRHTIVYTTYQPWCIIDVKPGMRPEIIEEACETKLVYLGDNLLGELKCKPLTMQA